MEFLTQYQREQSSLTGNPLYFYTNHKFPFWVYDTEDIEWLECQITDEVFTPTRETRGTGKSGASIQIWGTTEWYSFVRVGKVQLLTKSRPYWGEDGNPHYEFEMKIPTIMHLVEITDEARGLDLFNRIIEREDVDATVFTQEIELPEGAEVDLDSGMSLPINLFKMMKAHEKYKDKENPYIKVLKDTGLYDDIQAAMKGTSPSGP